MRKKVFACVSNKIVDAGIRNISQSRKEDNPKEIKPFKEHRHNEDTCTKNIKQKDTKVPVTAKSIGSNGDKKRKDNKKYPKQ